MANNISHGNCSMTVSYDYISVIDRFVTFNQKYGSFGEFG
jgi:hypothetical protein